MISFFRLIQTGIKCIYFLLKHIYCYSTTWASFSDKIMWLNIYILLSAGINTPCLHPVIHSISLILAYCIHNKRGPLAHITNIRTDHSYVPLKINHLKCKELFFFIFYLPIKVLNDLICWCPRTFYLIDSTIKLYTYTINNILI